MAPVPSENPPDDHPRVGAARCEQRLIRAARRQGPHAVIVGVKGTSALAGAHRPKLEQAVRAWGGREEGGRRAHEGAEVGVWWACSA
jgi:hypothetical protein